MKKKIALILAAALAVISLSACGGSGDSGGGAETDLPKVTWRAQSVETSGTERQNCVEHFA